MLVYCVIPERTIHVEGYGYGFYSPSDGCAATKYSMYLFPVVRG